MHPGQPQQLFPLHPEQQLQSAPVDATLDIELAAVDQFRNRASITSVDCLDANCEPPECRMLLKVNSCQDSADTVLLQVSSSTPGDCVIQVRVKGTPTQQRCFSWTIHWEENSTPSIPPDNEQLPKNAASHKPHGLKALGFPYLTARKNLGCYNRELAQPVAPLTARPSTAAKPMSRCRRLSVGHDALAIKRQLPSTPRTRILVGKAPTQTFSMMTARSYQIDVDTPMHFTIK